MTEWVLSDKQWQAVAPFLPGKAGDRGRRAADNRRFLEANLLVARTGVPWRQLPPEFGKWYSVYTRCLRWQRKGVWPVVVDALLAAGVEQLSPDTKRGLRWTGEVEPQRRRSR